MKRTCQGIKAEHVEPRSTPAGLRQGAMLCRGHEMSGHMLMTPGVQPTNIPWPEHSFSVAVESFVKGAKSMQKWEVHFFAPGLAVWTLPMPWVSQA